MGRQVEVMIPDGRTVPISYSDSDTAVELKGLACNLLNIDSENRQYFSLTLPDEKSLKSNEITQGGLYSLQFQYYPSSSRLSDEALRQALFYQIKQDLRSGKMECGTKCRCLLETYIIQMEQSDYDEKSVPNYSTCLSESLQKEFPKLPYLMEQMHILMVGLSRPQCIVDFVDYAMKLPSYGMRKIDDSFRVTVNTKFPCHLAYGQQGVLLYHKCRCHFFKRDGVTKYSKTFGWRSLTIKKSGNIVSVTNMNEQDTERVIKIRGSHIHRKKTRLLYQAIQEAQNFYLGADYLGADQS